MTAFSLPRILMLFAAVVMGACSSGGQNSPNDDLSRGIDANSLATVGCQNVVIVNGFAYAACGSGIEVVQLATLERNFIPEPADDITSDSSLGLLFTQSGSTLQQFDLVDPMEPNLIATAGTNFSIFSGVSAANGILVVSAGSTASNTEVYAYDATTLSLLISGIPLVDDRTGNPDVHVASILTPRLFTGTFGSPFGPANFPMESEFLNDRLYVAHFAANGIHVIDLSASNALTLIPLGYEPTNIATDGVELFVVAVELDTVDIINPVSEEVVDTIALPLRQPIGVAASTTHIAVADRVAGLIVVTR